MPDWGETIIASRYLGVGPWELEDQEYSWLGRALVMRSAEIWAENEANAHSAAMARASSGRGRGRAGVN